MTLTKYEEKRNFNVSPEPTGGKPDSDKLRFVIQKHEASHLHYDFRLEIDGVLKSWAVPKGPSTDPAIKRLAMMVEDHPYDYINFEGIIPSGYGAGKVIIWDEGFYELADADGRDKALQDDELQKGILAGKLHILLFGQKLKGEYALVKTHNKDEKSWLIFKVKDNYVSKDDITLKDKSVVSNKTLAQMGKPSSIGKSTQFPYKLSPMLATPVDKPFDDEGWQFEIKWDGYRTLAFCNKEKVELKSRNDKSFNEKFYPFYQAVQRWNIHAVVDGEMVVMDEGGKSKFGALQNWQSEANGAIYYYVFDLLWKDGKDLMQRPLSERRDLLKLLVRENEIIRFSENFEVSGIELFETVKIMGLEGIMAKKTDSFYTAGIRSRDWLKIKANKHQEMVIGGYTKNEETSKPFSSLLLGVYEKGALIYTGKVGTGFNPQQQVEMLEQFKPYILSTSPFSKLPDINKPSRFQRNPPKSTAVWLKPELVCEVSFTEMTSDGLMRHPSFKAIRMDKNAKEVVQEIAMKTPDQKTFDQVIEAANVTNYILEKMGVLSYPKTSGSTGLHIYIPMGAKYTYEQSKEFARLIATLVHREIPKYTSIERSVNSRKGKIYIDFLQNRRQSQLPTL